MLSIFRFEHCLLVKVSQLLDIVSLIVWLVLLGVECFCLQEMFEGWRCLYLHKSEHSFPICLESEDWDPHHTRDPIIKANAVCHSTVFCCNVCYHIVHLFVFNMSNIWSDSFITLSVWNGKRVFLRRFYSWLSFCLQRNSSFVVDVYLSFFWWPCIEAPLCTTTCITVKHVFEGDLTCLTQLFNFYFPILFYHVPPISLDSDNICFGAPKSLSASFIDDWEDVLSNNRHTMGGICKEGWLWGFLIKFSFRYLQNLNPETYQKILEHSSHCAIVVTDDDINNEKLVIEGVLYHLQNSTSLETFWSSL